jgi:hypothetical protein
MILDVDRAAGKWLCVVVPELRGKQAENVKRSAQQSKESWKVWDWTL